MVIEWERIGRGRSAEDVEWLRRFLAGSSLKRPDRMVGMDAVERAARIAVSKRLRLMDSGDLDAAIAEIVEEAKMEYDNRVTSEPDSRWREQGGLQNANVTACQEPGPLSRAQELLTSLRALEENFEQASGLLLGFPEKDQAGHKPKLPSGESLDAMLAEAGTRAALLVGFTTGLLNRLRQ